MAEVEPTNLFSIPRALLHLVLFHSISTALLSFNFYPPREIEYAVFCCSNEE